MAKKIDKELTLHKIERNLWEQENIRWKLGNLITTFLSLFAALLVVWFANDDNLIVQIVVILAFLFIFQSCRKVGLTYVDEIKGLSHKIASHYDSLGINIEPIPITYKEEIESKPSMSLFDRNMLGFTLLAFALSMLSISMDSLNIAGVPFTKEALWTLGITSMVAMVMFAVVAFWVFFGKTFRK